MAQSYSFADKITRYLKAKHGVDALVTGTGLGVTVSAAGMLERIDGLVTHAKLDAVAEMIKRRNTP